MFIKSRQLVLIGKDKEKTFIDTPGWLYHYVPFGVDVFIHHKVVSNMDGYGYR